ncbi:phosphoribosylformylglycinamidine synthase subunit PurQ [Rhodohalobacter sulfatireducens]|uniref:Phosphoribosylformylglycinamidine synthase subunit PurQ n=1 Tax=Rhodohalobacter sulfatireducens TaxID=2911366 RepID=A0ABS9K9X8_9BACT|nr:phosphoribosylformylglycinamidine synthase subunit PurQ [Rhodohalobacter sulfatireducens]MDR9366123.1 phosphoribosylformylglycinamidine synthase subunit PurQ [Balneolaceae bacterium]MDR9410991.1 phosphoribosylformylglycinamidine synthase subunit PurQ [Balneolaceae bacterium]
MSKKIGVIVFPGSNCDHDAYHAMKHVMNADTTFLWHKDKEIGDLDLVIVPGGFSYGDYLRSGAIARFSPIMEAVQDYVKKGFPVLGICNGFQILLEAGLLPGAMLHNEKLRFVCKNVNIRVENNRSLFTSGMKEGTVLNVPVSHGEGNYFIDDEGLSDLKEHEQIAFRYCDANGNVTQEANFNGSVDSIAGIINKQGNVLGMMPHPERAMEPLLGSSDGIPFFESIFNSLQLA